MFHHFHKAAITLGLSLGNPVKRQSRAPCRLDPVQCFTGPVDGVALRLGDVGIHPPIAGD